jgi:hypothetical protein
VLLTSQRSGETSAQLQGADEAGSDRVEVLRRILATEQQRDIAYDEAREIGDSLIEFYQVLAEEVCDDPES